MFSLIAGIAIGVVVYQTVRHVSASWHSAGQVVAASVTDLDEYRARRLDSRHPGALG